MSPRQAASGGLASIPPVDQNPRVLRPVDVPSHRLHLTTRILVCVPPLVGRNRAGLFRQRAQEKIWKFWPHGGNPWQNFGRRLWRGLTPPHTLRSTGRGAGTWLGAPPDSLRAKKKFGLWKPGGNPWRNFGRRGREGLTPPRTPPGIGGAAGRRLWGPAGLLRAQ